MSDDGDAIRKQGGQIAWREEHSGREDQGGGDIIIKEGTSSSSGNKLSTSVFRSSLPLHLGPFPISELDCQYAVQDASE